MKSDKLIIGSRGSDLALFQANFIRDILTKDQDCDVDIKVIRTSGDKIDNISFDKMEGKGFFTKELEDALLANEIDLAVHSLKDLMTTQPEQLKLGAVGYRVDRRELLLIRKESRTGDNLLPIKDQGTIGTSSARRKCQIAHFNPSLNIIDLRGNVPTRIRKLREGPYDAIIVAAAGVARLKLDISDLEAIYLDPETFLPAPAQGILGIQIRGNDPRVETLVSPLNSPVAALAAQLERGLLAKFDAGCSLPLGVFSEVDGEQLRLKAVLGQRQDDTWTGLKQLDISGSDPVVMVDRAYEQLGDGTS